MSISGKAIKICAKSTDVWLMSYQNLHEMAGRATPEKLQDYKLALQLYKTFNDHIPTPDWIRININNIQTTRQTKFMTSKETGSRSG